jgi:ElaA protein
MSLQWKIKAFDALSVHELYDLLRLRSEIFVVEQNCVYLDLDGKDKVALHLIGDMKVK